MSIDRDDVGIHVTDFDSFFYSILRISIKIDQKETSIRQFRYKMLGLRYESEECQKMMPDPELQNWCLQIIFNNDYFWD